LYDFIANNGALKQALPLSIQPELWRVGGRGTLGGVLNISYENVTLDNRNNATVSIDYIITAAHVPYRFYEKEDREHYKIRNQIKIFNEKNIFANYSIRQPKFDYALLPCIENSQQNTQPVFGNYQFANLNRWRDIWPHMNLFALFNCTVFKKGCRTGVTFGKIMGSQESNGTYRVYNDKKNFSEKGDSGAIVFLLIPETNRVEPNKLFPVGLIVSGDVREGNKKISNFISLYDLFLHFCKKQSINGKEKTLDITFKSPKLEGIINFTSFVLKNSLSSIPPTFEKSFF
jgi:hypothetical protein